MPHPGDNGSFGALFNGDAFRAGHGPAANRRGMFGDSSRQSMRQLMVRRMEVKKLYNRPRKVLDVLALQLFPTDVRRLLPFGVRLRGSFGFEFGPDAIDRFRWSPNPSGESSSTLLLLHDPVIARCLDATSQTSIAG